MPPEICIFQRLGQYTEGEAEGHGLSPRLGGATPLLPLFLLVTYHESKLAAPGRGLILQRHQLLSKTGARDHNYSKTAAETASENDSCGHRRC